MIEDQGDKLLNFFGVHVVGGYLISYELLNLFYLCSEDSCLIVDELLNLFGIYVTDVLTLILLMLLLSFFKV